MWNSLYNQIISFIKQLLNVDGAISSIRYMSVLTVTVMVLTWSYLCIKNNMILDLPMGVYIVFLTAITGKVAQKFAESDTNPIQSRVEPLITEGIK